MGHKELDTTEWLTHISQNHSKKPFRETQESENWFFTHTGTRLCGFHPSIIWREDYVPSWLNVLDFPLSVLLESVYCFIACVLSCFSPIWLFVTLWTVTRQAPLSMWFSRQEYWSGLPFPSSGDHPDLGIKFARQECLSGLLLPSPGDLSDPGVKMTSLVVSCIGRWIF